MSRLGNWVIARTFRTKTGTETRYLIGFVRGGPFGKATKGEWTTVPDCAARYCNKANAKTVIRNGGSYLRSASAVPIEKAREAGARLCLNASE